MGVTKASLVTIDPQIASRKRKRKQNGGQNGHLTRTKAVQLDALPWAEATLPDRLDDAEGFFGLEEVSDVEVVKDAELGRVEYRVVNDARVEDAWEGISDTESWDEPVKKKSQSIQPKGLKTKVPKNHENGLGDLSETNGFAALNDNSIEERDVSAWHSLGLSSEVLASLAKLRFSEPTPIQMKAIPVILDGYDAIGKASTGSGKTLAFGIPIVEHYLKHCAENAWRGRHDPAEREDPPTALIISPTRELAHQLSAHLTDLCSHVTSKSPVVATLTGGLSLQKQQRILANADIIIGTPGRLWEIISSSSKGLLPWLQRIKFLVLDEADRLLSEGHYQELEEILTALDRTSDADETSPPTLSDDHHHNRQTLIFSATFVPTLHHSLTNPRNKNKSSSSSSSDASLAPLLSRLHFRANPQFIDASPLSHLPNTLTSHILTTPALSRDLHLYTLLLTHFPTSRTLVFTNSISCVRRLVPLLQELGLGVQGLHSQMPQKARLRAVERFSASSSTTASEAQQQQNKKQQKSNILIATDVAARGLDIPDVQAVVHYHLPRTADAYVHRSGRTARKGNAGRSILLCAPEEVRGVKSLVAQVYATTSNHENSGLRTITLDTRVLARLNERLLVAQRISDTEAKVKKSKHEDSWMRAAAEELGVEYDSEEFASSNSTSNNRNSKARNKGKMGKKNTERGQGERAGKEEVKVWRRELGGMLSRRVNLGVSERYLSAAGGVDVEALLDGGGGVEEGGFLGRMEGM
ncbi:MAG: hypothetical protein Q9220_000413 [cf. Caloplaca sp. 1 TL-2023]